MASDVVKGGWAPDEDEKLVKGIERYGTRYIPNHPFLSLFTHCPARVPPFLTDLFELRWSLVASVVQTRNSDRKSINPDTLIAYVHGHSKRPFPFYYRVCEAVDGHAEPCH